METMATLTDDKSDRLSSLHSLGRMGGLLLVSRVPYVRFDLTVCEHTIVGTM